MTVSDYLEISRKSTKPILTVCLSPGFQQTYLFKGFHMGVVNRAFQSHLDAAGKGANVSRCLKQLSVNSICLSQGGSNASRYQELASKEGLTLDLVSSTGPLRTCTTVLNIKEPETDDSGVVVSELIEEAFAVDGDVSSQLLSRFSMLVKECSLVCISGSKASGYEDDIIASLVRIATENAVEVILDVRGSDLILALKEQPSLVKINLDEFVSTFLPQHAKLFSELEAHGSHQHLADINEMLKELSQDSPCNFVLTRGALPVLVASDGVCWQISQPRLSNKAIKNPIGSGDAFLAGMAVIWSVHDAVGLTAQQSSNKINQESPAQRIILAVELGIACGQSNAKTYRPAHLEADFLSKLSSAH